MPVLGFTGLPGHGKSYGVVANVILPGLSKGRTVVTNIPINRRAMRSAVRAKGARGPLQLLSIDIADFAPSKNAKGEDVPAKLSFAENIPDGAVVVLDELWRLWPSGLRADKVPEDHKAFLAEHRHRVGRDGRTMEIVLVTQDLSQIAAFAKVLVEKTYQVAKLKELGATNLYSVSIYSGQRSNNQGGQLIGKSRGKYDPEIFKLYKSHTKSDSVGIETDADSRGTVFSAGIVRFGIPAIVLLVLLGGFGLRYSWSAMYGSAETLEDHAATVQKPVQFTRQPVSAPASYEPQFSSEPMPVKVEPQLSRVWRIAGTIEQGEIALAYLIGRNGYRYVDLSECELLNEIQLQYSCEVDGEIVTSWSGNKQTSVGEVLGTPAT